MEYWKDESEPIKAFLKLFESTKQDKELTDGLKKVNQLIWFDYTEDGPNCSYYWDCREQQPRGGCRQADEARSGDESVR